MPGIPEGAAAPETDDDDAAGRVHLHDLKPALTDVAAEVRAGLGARPLTLPPKFFYDERGSELFERITALPEYYPTDVEIGILGEHLDDLCAALGRGAVLVEYGSGASRKIRLLLDGLEPAAYMPLDISRDHLLESARSLAADHPDLAIHAVCADYTEPLTLPWRLPDAPLAGFFPGSSIGNFDRAAAARFLARARDTLGTGARFLVGVDRRKDRARLEAAYDDAAGVTAAFNRNVLVHLKRELGGDVDPDAFDHRAFWNEAAGRIEMHLVAREALRFRLGEVEVAMDAGETIHTESSHKYDPEEFAALADGAGWSVVEHRTDAEALFSVFVLEARDA